MKKRTRTIATRLIATMNKLANEHPHLPYGTITEIINNMPTVIVGICNDNADNEYADDFFDEAVESLKFIEDKLGITE